MNMWKKIRGVALPLSCLLMSFSTASAADPQIRQVSHTGIGNYGTVMPYQGAQAGVVNFDDAGNAAMPHYQNRYAHTAGYKSFTHTPGGRIYPCECGGECGHVHCTSDLAEMTWNFRMRNAAASQRLRQNWCQGNGVFASRLFWWDMGAKKEIIAVDPGYHDQRDSELYATQMYGVPVAVPLAPTVRSSYNYGWGMPSSRLTPVATLPVP